MSLPRLLCLLAPLLPVAFGCAPKATFEVTVVNKTDQPLTVGLVKDGPPYEREWAGPEQLAIESPPETLAPWGVLVPPGRTIDSPPTTGSFPEGTLAYLRVYRGEHTNAGLLAVSSPSPDRAEVLIYPGRNEVVVTYDAEGLHAQRIRRLSR
jgi:hypothetical protein